MTKKQLEERVAQLEKKVEELQSQLLSLALRTPSGVTIYPLPQPATVPNTPAWPPHLPYIGDLPPYSPNYPTITCSSQSNQNRQDAISHLRY